MAGYMRFEKRASAAFARVAGAIGVAALLMTGAALVAQPAQAQSDGVPRTEIVKLLGQRYAESPVSMGLAQNGGVVEVFATRDGSTWTIVLTMPDGTSRVMGSGEAWTPVVQLAGQKV